MKTRPVKIIAAIFILLVSCNEPETVVTDYVNTDGSVRRVIVMKSISEKSEDRFRKSDIQVPLDSTWKLKDSIELSKKGDSIWVRKAEKVFKNVDEINLTYKSDSGPDKFAVRHATFKKSFKWFNTEFRFSENIDQSLANAYPLKDFLNEEELHYFYAPDTYKSEKEGGADSLKYKSLNDSISRKTDRWTEKNFIAEWIAEFANLTQSSGMNDLAYKALKAKENDFLKIVHVNSEKFDSLWKNGTILRQFIGENNALKFKTEADSAYSTATRNILTDFKGYSVSIVMPGKLTATNGFIDSSKVLLWPVKNEYFMSQPYAMWAESRITNRWAWVVSGLFLLFVLTGFIIRLSKKG